MFYYFGQNFMKLELLRTFLHAFYSVAYISKGGNPQLVPDSFNEEKERERERERLNIKSFEEQIIILAATEM
jgi:hypothetical protein